jgi:hypothetical protein
MTEDLARVTIRQTKGEKLKFVGRLVDRMSTDEPGKDRWQEMELWETPAGTWIAVLRLCSDLDREQDFVSARVIPADLQPLERQLAAMDAWEWSLAARIFARKELKWKMEREVV